MSNALETTNSSCVGVDFLAALKYVLQGERWSRYSWYSGMCIYLVPGSTFTVHRPPLHGMYPEGTSINYRPHIDIVHDDGTCGVWNPTQDDMFAKDWFCVATEVRN